MPFLSVSQKKIDKSKDLLLFIDGTVASVYTSGDDAKSLIQFVDSNRANNHTYYGLGCPNGWGTDGNGGSDIPCTTRIVQTKDEENQKNGTYYSNLAAVSGSARYESKDNTIAPDSFCPLGWQLPYSGTGGDYYNQSKSWKELLIIYNLISDQSSSTKFHSYPTSYVESGVFGWFSGRLYYQNSRGYYWSTTTVNTVNAYSMNTWDTGINTSVSDTKAMGSTVRCDCRISNLKSSPWHPRKTLNILGFIKLLNEPEME